MSSKHKPSMNRLDSLSYARLFSSARNELQDCPRGSSQCSHCAVEFRVDPQTHMKHRGYLREKREFGGSLRFDFRNRTLVEGVVGKGAYNSISMTRGGVDWHSHPSTCLNDNMCALGVPSPMDLQNITLGCLFGTVAHMVYAREGTYLVQLDPALLTKLKSSVETVTLFFADVDRTFSALHKEFIKSTREPYKKYSRRFRRVARTVGFRIKLFKGNQIPHIRFKCLCDLLESDKVVSPDITVPALLEQVVNAK